MNHQDLAQIRWEGHETMDEIAQCLSEGKTVELALPNNDHHALFAHLYPDAAPSAPEVVREDDGKRVIEAVCTLPFLGRLREFLPQVESGQLYAAVISPPPVVILSPNAERIDHILKAQAFMQPSPTF